MKAYYNEHDPKAAAWLRELMRVGAIMDGVVDERSIAEVRPADLVGFARVHFFAGIGGWDYALKLAGWPADRPIWTGSCPCQPFSAAGRGRGHEDARHLWPEFQRLIAECRPPVVLGEQVASRLGRTWLAAVRADLEELGYGVGAADLCAAGVGAPHIRQRLYWVADAEGGDGGLLLQQREPREDCVESERSGEARGLAQPTSAGGCGREPLGEWRGEESGGSGPNGGVGDTDEPGPQGRGGAERGQFNQDGQASPSGAAIGMGNANSGGRGQDDRQPGECGAPDGGEAPDRRSWRGDTHPWADLAWLPCRDGKARPTQPGLQPLAHGVPGRVGLLRGYGNAIVPQVAAAFIEAYRDVTEAA